MQRGNYMDPDEIADGFKALFDQAHAIEDQHLDARGKALLRHFHMAGAIFRRHCRDSQVIQPFSGGDDDKPPG